MKRLGLLGVAAVLIVLGAPSCDKTDEDDQGDADADDDIGNDSVNGDSANSPCDPPCSLTDARCEIGDDGEHIAVMCNMQTRCRETTVCDPGVECGMQTGLAECGLDPGATSGW